MIPHWNTIYMFSVWVAFGLNYTTFDKKNYETHDPQPDSQSSNTKKKTRSDRPIDRYVCHNWCWENTINANTNRENHIWGCFFSSELHRKWTKSYSTMLSRCISLFFWCDSTSSWRASISILQKLRALRNYWINNAILSVCVVLNKIHDWRKH